MDISSGWYDSCLSCTADVELSNFRSYRDLPGGNRQESVAESPIERLSDGLERKIVVLRHVFVLQGFDAVYSGLWVENQHFLQKIDCIHVCSVKLLREIDVRLSWQPLQKSKAIPVADSLDNIVRRRPQQIDYQGQLLDMVLSGEQWLSLKHFCDDTTDTPDIDRNVIFLPGYHDLWRTVVPGGDVSRHLGGFGPCRAKVTNLQIHILVQKYIGWFDIAMNNACGVNILKTTLTKELDPVWLVGRGMVTSN
jgi:hypothetical protein